MPRPQRILKIGRGTCSWNQQGLNMAFVPLNSCSNSAVNPLIVTQVDSPICHLPFGKSNTCQLATAPIGFVPTTERCTKEIEDIRAQVLALIS